MENVTMAQETLNRIEKASWDANNNYDYGYGSAVAIAREHGFEIYNANERAGAHFSHMPSRKYWFIDGSRLMVTSSIAYIEE